MRLLVSVNVKS